MRSVTENKPLKSAPIAEIAAQFDRAVNALSSQFDAIEAAVEQIDKVEMRRRWANSVERGREALGGVLLSLNRKVGNLAC